MLNTMAHMAALWPVEPDTDSRTVVFQVWLFGLSEPVFGARCCWWEVGVAQGQRCNQRSFTQSKDNGCLLGGAKAY